MLRPKHMSRRTEASYLYYILRFIRFHGKRHPHEMGVEEIRTYLSHLATDKNVAASTQNVALSSLLFLYRQVLHMDLPEIDNVERARRPKWVTVVALAEVEAILAQLTGTHLLVNRLALRHGDALVLMPKAAGKGPGLRVPADHGERRQG